MTDLSVADIVLQYVCPALGMVIANIMFAAPYRDLQKAVQAGRGIGSLNPTPWAFMLGNCVGWTTYGILKHNWFLFFANCPGFLLSVWLNLGAVKLLYQSHHSTQWRDSVATYLSNRERESLITMTTMAQHNPSSMTMAMTMMAVDGDDDDDGGGDDRHHDDSRQEEETGVTNGTHYGTCTTDDATTDGTHRGRQLQNDDSAMMMMTLDVENPSPSMTDTPNTTPTPSSSDVSQHHATTTTTPPPKQEWVDIVWQVTSQSKPAPTPHERLVMGMTLLWTTVIAIIGLSSLDDVTVETMVGYVVNFNLVFFYGAPLSTIWTVLGMRDSSSIHIPTMMSNTLNGSFWTAYGIAVQDPFIYVPNGMGAALGGVQIVLLVLFPRKTNCRTTEDDNDNANVVVDRPVLNT